jgi:hypothetical protein
MIITKVVSTYMIHLPGEGRQPPRWINLGNIERVDQIGEGELSVHFTSAKTMTVTGHQAEKLLEEIQFYLPPQDDDYEL